MAGPNRPRGQIAGDVGDEVEVLIGGRRDRVARPKGEIGHNEPKAPGKLLEAVPVVTGMDTEAGKKD